MKRQTKELKLITQLVGEWIVGVAMKTGNGKPLTGCGTMTAKELPAQVGITSEMTVQIENLDDYVESDLWSFDNATSKIHLFSVTSQGDAHDHIGEWTNDKTLELSWKGCLEKRGTGRKNNGDLGE